MDELLEEHRAVRRFLDSEYPSDDAVAALDELMSAHGVAQKRIDEEDLAEQA